MVSSSKSYTMYEKSQTTYKKYTPKRELLMNSYQLKLITNTRFNVATKNS